MRLQQRLVLDREQPRSLVGLQVELEPVESVICHALPPLFGYLTLLRYALPKVPPRGGPEPGSGAVYRHVSRSPRDERQNFWIGPAEAVSIRYSQGRLASGKALVEKGRGEKMLASVTDGLLSGLEMQAEMSELLEELYYESLT